MKNKSIYLIIPLMIIISIVLIIIFYINPFKSPKDKVMYGLSELMGKDSIIAELSNSHVNPDRVFRPSLSNSLYREINTIKNSSTYELTTKIKLTDIRENNERKFTDIYGASIDFRTITNRKDKLIDGRFSIHYLAFPLTRFDFYRNNNLLYFYNHDLYDKYLMLDIYKSNGQLNNYLNPFILDFLRDNSDNPSAIAKDFYNNIIVTDEQCEKIIESGDCSIKTRQYKIIITKESVASLFSSIKGKHIECDEDIIFYVYLDKKNHIRAIEYNNSDLSINLQLLGEKYSTDNASLTITNANSIISINKTCSTNDNTINELYNINIENPNYEYSNITLIDKYDPKTSDFTIDFFASNNEQTISLKINGIYNIKKNAIYIGDSDIIYEANNKENIIKACFDYEFKMEKSSKTPSLPDMEILDLSVLHESDIISLKETIYQNLINIIPNGYF